MRNLSKPWKNAVIVCTWMIRWDKSKISSSVRKLFLYNLSESYLFIANKKYEVIEVKELRQVYIQPYTLLIFLGKNERFSSVIITNSAANIQCVQILQHFRANKLIDD